MPRYYFTCGCGADIGVLRPPEKQRDPQICPKCGADMKRAPRGATSRIIETRDNGVMSRRVEQLADVERIMNERAHKGPGREP
jgi:hypothetical protein